MRRSEHHPTVDGAWWPYSTNMESELLALLETVAERINPIVRVLFTDKDWPNRLSRIQIDNRLARLDSCYYWPSSVIKLRGIHDKDALAIMLIPPQTSASDATTILATASHARDTSTVNELRALADARN
ncbi:DUF5994 family protein [Gordonia sp. CPCC 205333]|uniref:DUF5994 family protein n=1 Tax=Gordonia sp. CPCC 205333 TaxID=3140790 RepID=UPI003AF3512C